MFSIPVGISASIPRSKFPRTVEQSCSDLDLLPPRNRANRIAVGIDPVRSSRNYRRFPSARCNFRIRGIIIISEAVGGFGPRSKSRRNRNARVYTRSVALVLASARVCVESRNRRWCSKVHSGWEISDRTGASPVALPGREERRAVPSTWLRRFYVPSANCVRVDHTRSNGTYAETAIRTRREEAVAVAVEEATFKRRERRCAAGRGNPVPYQRFSTFVERAVPGQTWKENHGEAI